MSGYETPKEASTIPWESKTGAARTYARNFIDYFPHRELGIIYHKQGRHEESLSELNISLSALYSSRAESYLLLAEKSSCQK